MAIQCADVETLVQTRLDGELADEDARALEKHLAGCSTCNEHAAEAAHFHNELRSALAPPPAPSQLREQLDLALDREDWKSRQRRAKRWGWTLPAAASLAAVASLLLFVVANREPENKSPVTDDAIERHIQRHPLEVQGAAASPWVKNRLSPDVQLPRFSYRSTNLRGARISHLRGHDAAQVFYDARIGNRRYEVSAMIFDATRLDLRVGRRSVVGGRELWAGQSRGYNVVTYKDPRGMGYVFTSEMDADKLLDLVIASDLILRRSDSR